MGADADRTTRFFACGMLENTLTQASAHACRVEQGDRCGGDESRHCVGSDPRASAGAIEDHDQLPRQRVGVARAALFGLDEEKGRQLALIRRATWLAEWLWPFSSIWTARYGQPRKSGAPACPSSCSKT